MGMVEKILKVIKTERECVIRQGDISKCDRRCSECDLCLSEEEILEVYDFLIKGYEMLLDKGAEEYTLRWKEKKE